MRFIFGTVGRKIGLTIRDEDYGINKIRGVEKGKPADLVNLRIGDVITINDMTVTPYSDHNTLIRELRASDNTIITVRRGHYLRDPK